MANKPSKQVSGSNLVTDFQNVIISLATTMAAENAANYSEDTVLQQLSSSSSGNYLNPANIGQSQGDYVVRASIDAHIKKVQVEQLKSITNLQLQEIIDKDNKEYINLKVRIISTTKDYRPFDGLWYDQKSGQRMSEYKRQNIEGRIVALDFKNNLIVIKPTRLSQFFNTNLKNYIAYVINPKTLTPAVEINIL